VYFILLWLNYVYMPICDSKTIAGLQLNSRGMLCSNSFHGVHYAELSQNEEPFV
jgi:hypothetical protein